MPSRPDRALRTRTRARRGLEAAILGLSASFFAGHSLAASVKFTPVALSGTDGPLGPGLGAGVVFASFEGPQINQDGAVAFRATLSGAGVNSTNDDGIWRTSAGVLEPLVRTGTDGPLGPHLGPGETFSWIAKMCAFNNAGDIAWAARVEPDDAGMFWPGSRSMWRTSLGTRAPVAAERVSGILGPGLSPLSSFSYINHADIGICSFDENGTLALFGAATIPEVNSPGRPGVWLAGAGSPSPAAMESYSDAGTPDLGEPAIFQSIYGDLFPPIDGEGRIVFSGAYFSSNPASGLFRGLAGAPAQPLVLAETNDPLGSGANDGVYFHRILTDAIATNAADGIIFVAEVERSPAPVQSVWLLSDEKLVQIAEVGVDGPLGPNLGEGVRFSSVIRLDAMNAARMVGLRAPTFDGTRSSTGVWIASPAGLTPIALRGDDGPLGPALGPGRFFTLRPGVSYFGSVHLNDAGDALFDAYVNRLSGPQDPRGLWLWTQGRPRCVALEGDTIDVDPGPAVDLRVIDEIVFITGITPSGGHDGRVRCLNHDRVFTFGATFTDGSAGVFTTRADLVAADINVDRQVNTADLGMVLRAFGTSDPAADLDLSGTIDADDLCIMLEALAN